MTSSIRKIAAGDELRIEEIDGTISTGWTVEAWSLRMIRVRRPRPGRPGAAPEMREFSPNTGSELRQASTIKARLVGVPE